jgi:hypothetical protein
LTTSRSGKRLPAIGSGVLNIRRIFSGEVHVKTQPPTE